jgi:hypothetical protein
VGPEVSEREDPKRETTDVEHAISRCQLLHGLEETRLEPDQRHRPVSGGLGVEGHHSGCEDRPSPSAFQPCGDRVGGAVVIRDHQPMEVLAVLGVQESAEGGEG